MEVVGMYYTNQKFDHTAYFFENPKNPSSTKEYIYHRQINLNANHTQTLFHFEVPVKITPIKGLTLLVIKTAETNQFQTYLIESEVTLRKGIEFNVLCLSSTATVNLSTQIKAEPSYIKLDKIFTAPSTPVSFNLLTIVSTVSTLYSEDYRKKFIKQPHFEIIIVESGQFNIEINHTVYTLTKGHLMILPPDTPSIRFHHADKRTLTHSIRFTAEGIDSALIKHLINATEYLAPLYDVLHQDLSLPLGADKVWNQLDNLVFSLHQSLHQNDNGSSSTIMRERYESDIFNEIIDYIHQSDIVALKVSDLVNEFNLSRSTLQQLFNKYEHTTPKSYINQQRLEKSRQLIRESNLSITQIAAELGYGSIQYFSRAFSKAFNMSPSEYAKGYSKRM